MNYNEFLSLLTNIKPTPNGHSAQCPSHYDNKNSLDVSEGDDGRVLINCKAGCSAVEICRALKIKPKDLFPPKKTLHIVAEYDYVNEHGELLYQKVRYEPKSFHVRRMVEDKWIYQMGKDTRRVLYNLPAVIESDIVFVVEGEKDCDTLARHKYVATTNFDGAGKWSGDYNSFFAGKNVYIIPDNDEPGRKHAYTIFKSIDSICDVFMVQLPPAYKDVSDFFAAGRTTDELNALCNVTVTPDLKWVKNIQPKPVSPLAAKIRFASDIEPLTVQYTVPGFLPAGVFVMVVGQEGSGKSTLIDYVSSIISRGDCWSPTGDMVEQGSVVMFNHEQSPEHMIIPRLIANGAERNKIALYCDEEDNEPFAIERRASSLYALVEQMPDLKLVIFDPITSYTEVNENSNAEVRQALKPLVDFAQETGITVIGLSHLSKKIDVGMINRTIGSRAWSAVPRMIWAIQTEQETTIDDNGEEIKIDTDTRLLTCIKTNLGRKPRSMRFTILESGGVYLHPDQVDTDSEKQHVQKAPASGGRVKDNSIRDFILNYMNGQSVPSTEIMKAIQDQFKISLQRANQISKDMGIIKNRSQIEGGWVWRPTMQQIMASKLSRESADTVLNI